MEAILIYLAAIPVLLTLVALLPRLSYPLEHSYHFRFQFAVALSFFAIVFFGIGRLDLSFWCLVFATVNVWVLRSYLHPRVAAKTPLAGQHPPDSLRTLTLNVLLINKNYQAVLNLIKDVDPDFFAFQELNQEWIDALEPLRELYSHIMIERGASNYGVGFWSRLPVHYSEAMLRREARSPMLVAEMEWRGKPFRIVTAHPRSPAGPRGMKGRNVRLQEIGSFTGAMTKPRLVLGDLNTTPWSWSFRQLCKEAGVRDSGLGRGYAATWPVPLPFFLGIPIDHILHSKEIEIQNRWLGPRVGSDHLPLIVDFRIQDVKRSGPIV